jgi:hypothetical protein
MIRKGTTTSFRRKYKLVMSEVRGETRETIMSKLSDYSRFDHLDDEDDENAEVVGSSFITQNQEKTHVQSAISDEPAATSTGSAPSHSATQHLKQSSKERDIARFIVSFQGRRVYEWEQTLDSVTLFIPAPPSVNDSRSIICRISPKHLQLGLLLHHESTSQGQQQQWYLDEDTYGTVDTHESCWSLEDNESDDDDNDNQTIGKMIVIYLTKAHLGETWEAALRGNRKLQQNSNSNSSYPATSAVSLDPLAKQEIQKQMLLERFQQEHAGMDFRGATFNGGVPDPRTFLGGIPHK